MLFSSAIQGFILSKQIEGLSENTLTTYQYHLNHFCEWLRDIEVEEITPDNIKGFFYYLKTDYTPVRWNKKDNSPLANQTIRNIWIAFRSFWTWAHEEIDLPDAMVKIPCPKTNKNDTEPFSQQEIKALVKAVVNKRISSLRNLAIILTLLDTGIRASELCMLSIGCYDPAIGKIEIKHGKGNKRRFVYLGANARKALWKYLINRSSDSAAPLFSITHERQLNKRNLQKILERIGQKAGVKNVYPHRFRHTFAIEYLRNGGDIFTLQVLLGHSSLEMVRHYSKIASVDTQRMHARAGPVDNWL